MGKYLGEYLVEWFDDIREFGGPAEPLMLEDEASHSVMLGLIGLINRGEYTGCTLAVARRAGEPVLAAMRTPPHNLLLSHSEDPAAAAFLARELAHGSSTDLPGVLGPAGATGAFVPEWRQCRNVAAELVLRLGSYRLERVVPPAAVPGGPVRATLDDLDVVAGWLDAFHAESLPGPRPTGARERLAASLSSTGNDREYWLWHVAGLPVAMTGAGNPSRNGIRISAVYTPPEHRRRGYASALVAFVSGRHLDLGRRFTFLYADLDFPTSNRIYRSLGYRLVSELHEYRFTPAPTAR